MCSDSPEEPSKCTAPPVGAHSQTESKPTAESKG